MRQQRFWEVDLIALVRSWLADLLTLAQFVIVFMALALPVVIPGLLMWWFQVATGRP
jgi:hypothetical protein